MQTDQVSGRGLLGEDRFTDSADGRRLRVMQAGDGADLVVLEAGLGVSGLYWGQVHAALSGHVRVAAYERSGYGASSPTGTRSRDLAHLADDLGAVVDAIPHTRLVLVGHSWGGPIVRTLAARLLAQGKPPVGLVLVDQSDEHAADLYTSRAARWSSAVQDTLLVPLARLRLLAPLMRTQVAGLPEPLLTAVISSSSSVDAARATRAENRRLRDDLQTMQHRPPALGDLRTSVISGQKHTRIDRAVRSRLVQAHRDTVAENPEAHFVPAQRSGHMIPVSEPAVIVSEVLSLLPSPAPPAQGVDFSPDRARKWAPARIRGGRDMRSVAEQSVAELGGPISVLVRQKRDHVKLDGLLHRLSTSSHEEQLPVLIDLYRLVFPHAFAEESVLWPVMRRVLPDGEELTLQVEQEHQEVNELVTRLERLELGSPEREAALDRLAEVLREDVRDEEDELFPRLQERVPVSRLRLLGIAWEVVSRIAPTRAHPIVARRPPGNVIAALPLSILDRSRDHLDAIRLRGAGPAEGALHTATAALTRTAHAVEHHPALRRGEDPSTRVDPKPGMPWGMIGAGALVAVAVPIALARRRGR